jgi:hypothetical protein
MKRILAIVLAITFAAGAAADAAAQTASERRACKPDVFRLCSAAEIAAAALGDRAGIYVCFRTHRREVSPACDRVLTNHGY